MQGVNDGHHAIGSWEICRQLLLRDHDEKPRDGGGWSSSSSAARTPRAVRTTATLILAVRRRRRRDAGNAAADVEHEHAGGAAVVPRAHGGAVSAADGADPGHLGGFARAGRQPGRDELGVGERVLPVERAADLSRQHRAQRVRGEPAPPRAAAVGEVAVLEGPPAQGARPRSIRRRDLSEREVVRPRMPEEVGRWSYHFLREEVGAGLVDVEVAVVAAVAGAGDDASPADAADVAALAAAVLCLEKRVLWMGEVRPALGQLIAGRCCHDKLLMI